MKDTAHILIRTRLEAVDRRARLVLVVAQRAELELRDSQWVGETVPGWATWPEVALMCEETLAEVKRKRRLLERLEANEQLGSKEILDWLLES